MLDPNIETPTKESIMIYRRTDNEEKYMPATLEDPENKNKSMMPESSRIPEKPKEIARDNKGLEISWDVSPCIVQDIEFYEIQWKKTEEKIWSGRKCTDDNSSKITIPIAQLEVNTAYQFKVRWITKEGAEGSFSDISDNVIINASQKPDTPKWVTNEDNDLLLRWDVPSSALQAVDFFEMQWKKTEEKRWSGRKCTNDNSSQITIPFTELEMNTAYQFKVRWITKEGAEGPFSDISDTIVINASQKPDKPKRVTSNDTDLLLSWDVPSTALQAVDFFEMQWKKTEEKRWSGRKCTNDYSSKITIPITELEMNTAYQFKVRWITKEGAEGPFSDISDTIIINASQKPDKPKGVTSNDNDLLLNWDVPSSTLQAVDFFEMQWKKTEEKRWSGRKCTNDNSTQITIPITELEMNTAYQFKVRWITKEGAEGPFSDISDTIIINASQKPDKPKRVTSNVNDLLLSWDVPSYALHVVDFFEIQWKKTEEKRWSGRKCTDNNSSKITIPITELEMNTAYQFKVRWITKEGAEGPFSDISDTIIINASQKPDKPKGVTINDGDLLISWHVPSSDLQEVDFFSIQWKQAEEKRWSKQKNTDDNSTSITIPITEFEKNTAYEFKVRWTTTEGIQSPFSDISDRIMINISQKPGKPKGVAINDKDMLITWDVSPSDRCDVDFFEIQWKKKEEKRWSGLKCTDDNSTAIKIPTTEFDRNTAYQFKVRWVTTKGAEGIFSTISEDVIIIMAKKPDKPKEVRRNFEDLVMICDVSPSDIQDGDFFEIQWKQKDEKGWSGLKCTDDNATAIPIPFSNFKKNIPYQFKAKYKTKNGEDSAFSEISDDVLITRYPQEPGKVVSQGTTATSACLSWDKPEGTKNVSYYEVKYRKCTDVQWLSVNTEHGTELLDLKDLKSKHNYEFKVRAIFSDGSEGPFSEVSDTVTTQESLATRMKVMATQVGSVNPQRYKIPLAFSDERTNKKAMTRKGMLGERDHLHPTKTID